MTHFQEANAAYFQTASYTNATQTIRKEALNRANEKQVSQVLMNQCT